jgi:hypothetical protein
MRSLLDRLARPLHSLIALAATWLLASSPWLGMIDALPQAPGAIDLAHVVLGLALVPLAALYLAACTAGGRWRLYFPWLAGQFVALRADVAGLVRGQRPGSEGGGLFAIVEGLLLVALLAAVATGTAWLVQSDVDAALAWRAHHIVAARAVAALLVVHIAAVALHLVDLVRD